MTKVSRKFDAGFKLEVVKIVKDHGIRVGRSMHVYSVFQSKNSSEIMKKRRFLSLENGAFILSGRHYRFGGFFCSNKV